MFIKRVCVSVLLFAWAMSDVEVIPFFFLDCKFLDMNLPLYVENVSKRHLDHVFHSMTTKKEGGKSPLACE